jgi:HEAT repeat protein
MLEVNNLPRKIPIQEVIARLADLNNALEIKYLYRLSDLEGDDLNELEMAWSHIPTLRRVTLIEDVEKICADNYSLSYIALGLLAIKDPDVSVRLHGVRTLAEYEEESLIPVLLKLIEEEEDGPVRAAIVDAMGKYIYYGEIEEIPAPVLKSIEDLLIYLAEADPFDHVRRSSIEALGFSSRKEVNNLIKKAYLSTEKEWIASALFAIARSANKKWAPQVLEKLDNIHPTIRKEAAQAAGELEINEAVPKLIQLIEDPNPDVRMNSIWALSQIASDEVFEILTQLYGEADNQEEIQFLEEAIENLQFNQEIHSLDLMDFPEDYEDYVDPPLDDEELRY